MKRGSARRVIFLKRRAVPMASETKARLRRAASSTIKNCQNRPPTRSVYERKTPHSESTDGTQSSGVEPVRHCPALALKKPDGPVGNSLGRAGMAPLGYFTRK